MPDAKFQDRAPPPPAAWLKRNVPKGNANHFTARLIDELGLQTVCDHARCPNRMECYAAEDGHVHDLGRRLHPGVPFLQRAKGAAAAAGRRRAAARGRGGSALGLAHVVITCVTRDDLPDGGAEHFVRTIAGGPPGAPGDDRGPALRLRRQRGRGRSADRRRPGGLQPQHGDRAAALSRGPRPAGRLPLDAGHVPPHRPANPAISTEDRPDARAGRDDARNCSTRWPICSTPAAGC